MGKLEKGKELDRVNGLSKGFTLTEASGSKAFRKQGEIPWTAAKKAPSRQG